MIIRGRASISEAGFRDFIQYKNICVGIRSNYHTEEVICFVKSPLGKHVTNKQKERGYAITSLYSFDYHANSSTAEEREQKLKDIYSALSNNIVSISNKYDKLVTENGINMSLIRSCLTDMIIYGILKKQTANANEEIFAESWTMEQLNVPPIAIRWVNRDEAARNTWGSPYSHMTFDELSF